MSRSAHIFYRHNQQPRYFVDRLVYVAGIAQPLMTAPQIYQIITTQNVEGLSFLTWLAYTIFGGILLVYDIQHRILPLILTQTLWLAADLLVLTGILIYK